MDVNVVSPTVCSKEKDKDEDSDVSCIILSSDESVDLGSVDLPQEKIQVDLTKVKCEKDSDEIPKIPQIKRDIIKNMVKKNAKGRILCPLKCGKDFKNSSNMFRHIDSEVCSKPVSERSTLVCCIKGCEHTCVTKQSMKSHKLSHFKLKPFECPVQECDHCFVQQSSLSNHKHIKHPEIFGPFPVPKKDKKKMTKKAKRRKRKRRKRWFSVLPLKRKSDVLCFHKKIFTCRRGSFIQNLEYEILYFVHEISVSYSILL